MAKINYSALITGIRGRYNGSQFSVNKSGSLLQNKSIPPKRVTDLQGLIRSRFSRLARFWRQLSTSEQQSNNDAAPNYPYTDKFGNIKYFTGYQLLLRSNLNRAVSGLQPIRVVPMIPPQGLDIGETVLYLSFAQDQGWAVSANWQQDFSQPTGYDAQVYVSKGISPGQSVYNDTWYYVGSVNQYEGLLEESFINSNVINSWGYGTKVFCRVSFVHLDSGVTVAETFANALVGWFILSASCYIGDSGFYGLKGVSNNGNLIIPVGYRIQSEYIVYEPPALPPSTPPVSGWVYSSTQVAGVDLESLDYGHVVNRYWHKLIIQSEDGVETYQTFYVLATH